MSDHHESRVLLAILREDWPGAERLTAGRPVDPQAFVAVCRECDVHPWVHAVLERHDRFGLVGDAARERLAELRHKVRSDNLLLLAIAEKTLDLLREAGIRPVALKGLDVMHRYYERFDERAIDDIDLLMRPDQVERALVKLEGAGYAAPQGDERAHWLRSSFEMPLHSPGPVGVLVEIHWSLGQEKRYRVGLDDVLARAVPLTVAGREIRRLETHDAAAHLLLHHVQHYFDRRLKWTLEFLAVTREPDFSWQRLAERVRAWGGRQAAAMALLHLRKLFPDAIPDEALRVLPAARWRRALLLPLRSDHPLDLLRATRRRRTQLWLAAVLLERPWELPGYLRHMRTRDRTAAASAVERDSA